MASSENAAAGIASSSPAQSFQHSPLTEPESEIRLLRILPVHQLPVNGRLPQKLQGLTLRNSGRKTAEAGELCCEMFHVTLDRAPPYKALSYAWGNPDARQYPMRLNWGSFLVRENLWFALQQLHLSPTPIFIWIDAVCINQTDGEERNEQVTKMKTIYERAEEVVVWLGPSSRDSHLAFPFMQEMYDHRDDIDWIVQKFQQPGLRQSVLALSNLLARDYWRRMWIFQELIVAKCISVHCGADSIGGVALDETQRLLLAMNSLTGGFKENHLFNLLPTDTGSVAIYWVMWGGLGSIRNWQQTSEIQDLSFFQCLLYNWTRESTDPRDMVYGLAAIANSISSYQIKIDYSLSTAAIYIDLATKEIRNCKTLEILTRALPCLNLVGLPSWVPDWSRLVDGHYFLYDIMLPRYEYSAAGGSTCDASVLDVGDILILKGVVIGKVKMVAERPVMTGTKDLENAGRVFLAWWAFLGRNGDRRKQTQEQFGRTLICDMVVDEELGSCDKDEFCQTIIGMFYGLCADLDLVKDADILLAKIYSDIKERWQINEGPGHNEQRLRDLSRAWIQHSACFIWDRQLFLGASNIMGLAPEDVKEGDIICVPLGCPHPMIFRKFGEHYVVIGEAYVDGYMRGEAMKMLERGELELETFELH